MGTELDRTASIAAALAYLQQSGDARRLAAIEGTVVDGRAWHPRVFAMAQAFHVRLPMAPPTV